MSEPITRADYAKWLRFCGDLEMLVMFEDWCAHNPAESASPPRVPGASAQRLQVGVESGPGQPMDICDLLKLAEGWGDPAAPAAVLAREAAAEITRLREQVGALEHEAANMANRRVELEDSERLAERRAGIEAAAKWHEHEASAHYGQLDTMQADWHVFCAVAIRALADKPAPDALLVGIEYVREHLRTDGNAVRLIVWLDAEIAARKGG